MGCIQHAEALGLALETPQAEEEGAEFDVHGDGFCLGTAFGELGQVHLEDRIKLLRNMSPGTDEGVGLCGHVEGYCLHIRRIGSVAFHDPLVGG